MKLNIHSEQPRGPMSHSLHDCWSIIILIHLLGTIESSTAEKPCTAFSSNGDLVLSGSNFQVFCTYLASCRATKSMYIDKIQTHQVQHYNSTTIFLNVTDIRKETTYTCKCYGEPEPCGLDVDVGYLPSAPEKVACIQKGEFGQVTCTWMRGVETKMNTPSELWVKAMNSTAAPVSYPGFDYSSDPGLVSAIFSVSGSNQTDYSVWANSFNKLGSAKSTPLNFKLDQIVQPPPPAVSQVKCCSRACEVGVEWVQGTLLLEVWYRAAQETKSWISHTVGSMRNQSNVSLPIMSLQPYTLYEFQARVKLNHSKGLWSDWSKSLFNQTEEEAPAKALDVWYTTSTTSNITLHWKNLSNLDARGRITGYKVIIHNLQTGMTENVTSTTTFLVPSCLSCNVTVYALNSRGSSPPTSVIIPLRTAQPPENVQSSHCNKHSFAISWTRPSTAGAAVRGYLVEWFPKGKQVEELRWKRLGPNEYHTVADDIKQYECYEGAVYVQYEQAMGRAPFEDISTNESAPSASPSDVQVRVNEDRVTVSWSEVPLGKQGGCVRKYTIYLKKEEITSYDCDASKRSYTITGLAQSDQPYYLWMSAWTSSGEGPHGSSHSFFIIANQNIWYVTIVVSCLVALVCFLLKRWVCHYFIPDIVLDPANSKWAKECAKEMGGLTLQLYVSESSISEEDEPETVEVQELPEESWCSGNPAQPTEISRAAEGASHLIPPQLSPVTDPSATAYFQNSYLQSFSQESGSSGQTQDTQGTDINVDYISTHLLVREEVDEDEQECFGEMVFFPCLPLDHLVPVQGKLTLDSVRIDCSGF
ncbi:interleukin-12 receptor subunit beta-2 [Esox lucius]|uniref:interleukin-12 receptor subunit beta-2 n=1 Tax=Esox lucius TaxID=8010 RepID=UPI001476858C|nr:interleukin-12 receptor subunit beta-2 [Esox lucius]